MRTVRSNPNSNSTKLRGRNASPLVKNRCLVCGVLLSSNHSIHCRLHYKSGRAKIRDEDVDDRVKVEVPHGCPQCGKPVHWIAGRLSPYPDLSRGGFFECTSEQCLWCWQAEKGYIYIGG